VCAEYLSFNADGTIRFVSLTQEGLSQYKWCLGFFVKQTFDFIIFLLLLYWSFHLVVLKAEPSAFFKRALGVAQARARLNDSEPSRN
jgi:hypothetical protein